ASWGSPSPAPQQPASDGGWAPPPVEPIPSAPAQSSWDQPSAPGQSSWDQPSAPEQPQSWDQGGYAPAPQWGSPAPAPEPAPAPSPAPAPGPVDSSPAAWGPPPAASADQAPAAPGQDA